MCVRLCVRVCVCTWCLGAAPHMTRLRCLVWHPADLNLPPDLLPSLIADCAPDGRGFERFKQGIKAELHDNTGGWLHAWRWW
jgi:hypothetical protein